MNRTICICYTLCRQILRDYSNDLELYIKGQVAVCIYRFLFQSIYICHLKSEFNLQNFVQKTLSRIEAETDHSIMLKVFRNSVLLVRDVLLSMKKKSKLESKTLCQYTLSIS